MTSIANRTALVFVTLLGVAFALTACGSNYTGEIWGVDYSKGVQLPPSEFPGPNNNPPPMTPKTEG